MFKWTGRSGRRNSSGGGVAQASRRIVSPNNKFRGTQVRQLHRPAFLPDTPQEQTQDSSSSRLHGLEDQIRMPHNS
jgi:hypothetical protein